MRKLILFLTVFLLSGSVFAQITPQPRPERDQRRQRPTPVPQTSTDPAYIPLDAAAAPCQMTVADAPAINGIKLGLTPDELAKAFKIKITPGAPSNLEVSTFSVGEKNKSALPKGINGINLSFFKNHLYAATIAFDNVSQPKTLDKFAMNLSEKHKFSKAWFKTARQILVFNEPKTQIDEKYVYLFCPGELRFELTINNDVQLRMLDLKTFNQVMQKRKQINSSKPQ